MVGELILLGYRERKGVSGVAANMLHIECDYVVETTGALSAYSLCSRSEKTEGHHLIEELHLGGARR